MAIKPLFTPIEVPCTAPNYNRNSMGPRPNFLMVIHSPLPKWKITFILSLLFCVFLQQQAPVQNLAAAELFRPRSGAGRGRTLVPPGRAPPPSGNKVQPGQLTARWPPPLSHTGHHRYLPCTHCHLCQHHCPDWGQLHLGFLKGICTRAEAKRRVRAGLV